MTTHAKHDNLIDLGTCDGCGKTTGEWIQEGRIRWTVQRLQAIRTSGTDRVLCAFCRNRTAQTSQPKTLFSTANTRQT